MKIKQLIAAAIAVSAIATVGSTFADSRSDGPTAVSTKTRAEGTLMNSTERVYIYEWARPEWIRPETGAHGVAGSRYSSRTSEEVKAELGQTRAEDTSMNSAERVYIYEWARPGWIRPNR